MARLTSITNKSQVAAKDQPIVDSIVASRGALQGPFTMFLHSPELAGRLAHLGAYVRFEGSLDMRVRVLAAMTVARELEAVYVWGAQTGGARKLGVPETTITAIRENHSRGVPAEDGQIRTVRQRRLHPAHRCDRLLQHAGDDRQRLRAGGGAGRRGAEGLARRLDLPRHRLRGTEGRDEGRVLAGSTRHDDVDVVRLADDRAQRLVVVLVHPVGPVLGLVHGA